MSAPKNQISPIPPEPYGDRFMKFISGLSKTKEEVEREAQASEQLNNSFDSTHANLSIDHPGKSSGGGIMRRSTEKVIEKAEKQARKSEDRGAVEDERRDRTITTVRSPSADRSNGIAGQTLPVVEEDGEANSREDSLTNEKAPATTTGQQPSQSLETWKSRSSVDRPDYVREKSLAGGKAAAILEQATGAAQVQAAKREPSPDPAKEEKESSEKPPPTPEKDLKYQKHQSLPRLPALAPIRMVDGPDLVSPSQ